MVTNRGFVFRETGEVFLGVRVVLHGVGAGGSSMLARKLEFNPIADNSGSGFCVQIFLYTQPYAY